MSDHCEEQEMEAEALTAIFDSAFEILSDQQPFEWSVKLLPVDCGGDEEEEASQNHVAVKLLAKIPLDYPEMSLPDLNVEIMKGLAEEHRKELSELAQTEAQNNEGMPAIFAVCEAIREWLADNNVKGLDDASMHAQMMRKQKEAEKSKALAEQQFEAQKKEEEMTQAELEELAVRTRRQEGTPCTKEHFLAWKKKFEAEMAQKAAEEAAEAENATGKKKEKIVDKSDRLTGYEHFSGKVGLLNMDAIEAAAEEAENNEVEVDELDVDEDLFDEEEDVDLDDLDFDDDSDDFDDDDEEEPDI